MIVVASHNGVEFLPKLLDTMPEEPFVVDVGSTDPEFIEYVAKLSNSGRIDNLQSIGAYKYAYDRFPDEQEFMFMHDSMLVKDKMFVEKMSRLGDVVGWLRFPMFFDNHGQQHYLSQYYDMGNLPDYGLFGPIFYAKRSALDKITWPVCETLEQAHAAERGLAIAFHQAGVKVEYDDDYDINRIYGDDYTLLTKFLPKRNHP